MKDSKYDDLKMLRKTTSRSFQICKNCGKSITSNDLHYREQLKDPHINFIGRRFCLDCYELHGNELLIRNIGKGKKPVEKGPIDQY